MNPTPIEFFHHQKMWSKEAKFAGREASANDSLVASYYDSAGIDIYEEDTDEKFAMKYASMADAWDACDNIDWLCGVIDKIRIRVMPDSVKYPNSVLWVLKKINPARERTLAIDSGLRKFALRIVRETPLGDGRTLWDIVGKPGRVAVETAEHFIEGRTTWEEFCKNKRAAHIIIYPPNIANYVFPRDAADYAAKAAVEAANAADTHYSSCILAAGTADSATCAVAFAATAACSRDDAKFAVADLSARTATKQFHARLLKKIIGNPFTK